MKANLVQKFQQMFGENGDIRTYFAPGRVNLIGEHTDYNGGHVFPCALTIGTYAVARKRDDDKIRFYSANFESLGIIETSLDDFIPSKKAGWTNYPKGVMWAFEKRGYVMTTGLDMLIYGDIATLLQVMHNGASGICLVLGSVSMFSTIIYTLTIRNI